MKLVDIVVYPIKSLRGVHLKESEVLESGLKWDRRWMLIDSENNFLSQRSHPSMVKVGVEILTDFIRVFDITNHANSLEFPVGIVLDEEVETSVWGHSSGSFVYPDIYNDWFSNYFNEPVRLVRMNPNKMRQRPLDVEPKSTSLSYADGYPFLVLSKASVQQVSTAIGTEIDIRQFRPNLVIDDCKAFEEDKLNNFAVGDVLFNMIKACKRCQIIGINQDSGVSSKQPTAYLSKTRRVGNHIIFGMNAALLKPGTIRIGDTISK